MARKPTVKTTVKTTEKDFGAAHVRKILNTMKAVPEGPHIKVGLLASSGVSKEDPSLSVVQIAIWNEFGTDTIPSRPFMRLSAIQLEPIMAKFTVLMLDAVASKKITLDNALDRMGLLCKAHIQKVIRDFKNPGNADRTIWQKARKAGRARIDAANSRGGIAGARVFSEYDNPLIDTGQMVGSINYLKVMK